MGVVTLSAAYGAGGPEIGPAVAELLGLPFHDRVIPVKVAGRLGVPVEEAEANDETVVTGLWRMVANLGTMPDAVGGVLPSANVPDARAFREQTERVLGEIRADLEAPHPMHRLLHGEVGSGKTVVAVATLLAGVEGSWQGAVMAPTGEPAVTTWVTSIRV